MNNDINNIIIANKYKLGIFDGKEIEPIRSEECVQNLANCLGIDRNMLVPDKNGKLKIVTEGWIRNKR